MRIQLEGEILFGPTLTVADMIDYSNEVSSLILNFTRAQVERPPTYGVPRSEQRLGAETQQATINFFGDESEPTGLWVAFFEALRTTDSGEIFFSAKYRAGVASETNPRFEGIIAIADMDAGTTVGEWKQQSKTFPARDVEGPLITDLA